MSFLNVRTRFCCHIDLLTHREAVTGYPAGYRLASFYTLGYEGLNTRYNCVRAIRKGWGSLYINIYTFTVWKIWRGVNFYYLCSEETQEEKY